MTSLLAESGLKWYHCKYMDEAKANLFIYGSLRDRRIFKSVSGLSFTRHHSKANNRALFAEKAIDIAQLEKQVESLEQEGKTVVIIAADAKLIGLIAIADTVKEHAAETVSWLKAHGKQVIMITGEPTAETAAEAVRLGAFAFGDRDS